MIIFSDIDGVITDGLYYISHAGDVAKGFSTRDMHSISAFFDNGYKFIFITGSSDWSTRNKFKKYAYNTIYECTNKYDAVINICKENNISPSECTYIGDSVNDYKAMCICGKKYCPSNAASIIKSISGVVCLKSRGGDGVIDELLFHAFRDDYMRFLT
jgi:YrbI family 3-deoxy-D-manno-octulosonate 8-phosphate phosphatase